MQSDAEKTLPNVILITLDAFNYELCLQNLDILPNFRCLKSEGVWFENAFSIGPTTHFAFPGIIAGVYPYHFGIGLDKNVTPIYDVLKGYGYNTALINDCNVLITPYFGYALNLDYQKHIFNLPSEERGAKLEDTLFGKQVKNIQPRMKLLNVLRNLHSRLNIGWLQDLGVYCVNAYRFLKLRSTECLTLQRRRTVYRDFLNEVLEFIGGRFSSPQFLWIHTVINHIPYLPPESGSEFHNHEIDYLNRRGFSLFVNTKVCGKLKRLYVESLKTTDDFIGHVVEALKTNGLLSNSIIIVTADHGEEFMEEGYYGHGGESSSDRLLHVPLIFYAPGFLQPKSVPIPVSTIDILPTICDLLGKNIPNSNRGLSLSNIILNAPDNSEELGGLMQRSLFTNSWQWSSLLDRSTGYNSRKRIFTVRKGIYKLTVTQDRQTNRVRKDKLELRDWVKNELLDLSSNKPITEQLLYLLSEHIQDEGLFARRIKLNAERYRIKEAARIVKVKGGSNQFF